MEGFHYQEKDRERHKKTEIRDNSGEENRISLKDFTEVNVGEMTMHLVGRDLKNTTTKTKKRGGGACMFG